MGPSFISDFPNCRGGVSRASPMADEIQVAVDAAGIAVVTLNRPERRNVVSSAMWRSLAEIYRESAPRQALPLLLR
jgi:enoyl-CoA hydratase/carnithine racemase